MTVMSAGPHWTEEQQRAIDRRDGDLLLDAAAGSGKTSVLVERFVAGVLEDGIDVARMLTITFTEKAAAELRDRIRGRLRALGAADAARQTERAFISTIHGFCARVLRAHALAAGLDPAFVVLDGSQTEPLIAAAFEDALADTADAVVDVLAAYGADPVRASILAVYGQLRSAGAIVPRLPPAPVVAAGSGPAREVAALLAAADALAAELGAIAEPGVKVGEALARLQDCRALAVTEDLWPAELEAVRLPRNGAALSTDACAAYTDALGALRAHHAARVAAPLRDALDSLLAAFGSHYERRKRVVSGLDFEDLELLCRELLAGNGELRERYAERFDRIMVDEFQDTNRVQLELIESIARGNLFTVGDAQQSIYGFRHAEVELFEARGERLEATGARETLQSNFRSRPEILDALNLAFADVLGQRFKPLHPGRQSARADFTPASSAPAELAMESAPADSTPAVELVLADKGADWEQDGVASPWRVAEARMLADRVAELVGEGWAPGEIVVLMRATTDMRAYERALEHRGLPTYVIGGRGYWSHPQVVDLVCCLRALANPRDEESLYSVLASPLAGVSLDALVMLASAARASGRDPWWVLREPGAALDGLGDADRAVLDRFVTWFGQERVRAARCATEELIDAVLERTGYDVIMLAMPGGRRRLANVRKLMRLAREHEAVHGPDLRGFLGLVADRAAGGGADARESEAPVEGEGLDAIRLMTIHRAKGLEFNVVCVADLGRTPRGAYDFVRVSADGRLGLRVARPGMAAREPALDYIAIGDERRAAEEAEEKRLFYVAMTRARERLVLSGAVRFEQLADGERLRGGPAAWIVPAFVPDAGALVETAGGEVARDGVRIAVRLGRPEDLRAAGADGAAAPAAPPATPPAAPPAVLSGAAPPAAAPEAPSPPAAPAPAPPVAALSYSSLGEYQRCGYRFYAERVLGLPPSPEAPPPVARVGVRPAADRGTLLHALLERIDFRRPVVPAAGAVAAAAARARLTPAPGAEEADELAAVVRQFAASALCARLARASEIRREERFAFAIADGTLMVGALDVLAREPGERALVVDYKSDRLAGADPARVVAGAYGVQQLVYALAALRSGASGVEVVHCFLERPDETVVAAFAQDQRPALEDRLDALTAGVRERRFEVTPAPYRELCAGCPAEGGLCSWSLEMTRRESPDTLF